MDEKIKDERRFSALPPQSVAAVAENLGIAELPSDISRLLAEDATYRIRALLQVIIRPQPKRLGAYRFGVSVRLSVRHTFFVRARTFERKVIETFLTISVKNTRPEVVKLAKIAKNSGFSRLELVRARTFERRVKETWL